MAKPKKRDDEKTQKERFIDTARELETDESGEAFESAIKTIIPPKQKPS